MFSFIFQPVILFLYLGILVSFLDRTLIGTNTTFEGDGRVNPKKIICNGENLDSIYCIFMVKEIKNFPGLEVIGIGLPVLVNMNSDKVMAILKAAIMLFVLNVIIEQIPEISNKILGGPSLKADWQDKLPNAGSAKEALRGIQKRGMGAIKKAGSAGAKKAKSVGKKIKDAVRGGGPKSSAKDGGADTGDSGDGGDKS